MRESLIGHDAMRIVSNGDGTQAISLAWRSFVVLAMVGVGMTRIGDHGGQLHRWPTMEIRRLGRRCQFEVLCRTDRCSAVGLERQEFYGYGMDRGE
jgi:hypothetical protein